MDVYESTSDLSKTNAIWKEVVELKRTILLLVISLVLVSSSYGYVFESDFTGPDDANVTVLPEWLYVPQIPPGESELFNVDQTLDNNQAKFAGQYSATTGAYSAIQANEVFNPMGTATLRFEFLIAHMVDLQPPVGGQGTINGAVRICLADTGDWDYYSWTQLGEKLAFTATWHRQMAGTLIDQVDLSFDIVNYIEGDIPLYEGIDVGETVFSAELEGLTMDDEGQLKIALEIRDDADANDVRVGYQAKYTDAAGWGQWVYSDWFDPVDGDGSLNLNWDVDNPSAFLSDWKTRWTDNTYFCIEGWFPGLREGIVWLDDAVVVALGQPDNCEELWRYNPDMGRANDLNRDCSVSLGDFALLAADWMSCNDPEDQDCVPNW